MDCLVLGAGGFIGQHLVEELLASGKNVLAYDRTEALRSLVERFPQVRPVDGDFQKENRWNSILDGVKVCYHLISTTVPQSSSDNPIADVTGNLIGTLQLLEAARSKSLRLVFASSGGTVYGMPRAELITEEHPTDPLCSYGVTKLAIEKYLQIYHEIHGVQSVVLRIANPYGPGQAPDSIQGAIAVFSGRVLRGHVVDIWGDGSIIRDYLFIKDVVSAMILATSYGGRQAVFNIGSGRGFSIREILSAIENASGKVAEVIHHPARGFDVKRSVLDISSAKRELNWEPKVNLQDGLVRTISWMQEHIGKYFDV